MMEMRVSKFCDKQTLGVLRQADAVMLIKEIWRKYGFSDACLYERLSKCGGMDAFQGFRQAAAQKICCASATHDFVNLQVLISVRKVRFIRA